MKEKLTNFSVVKNLKKQRLVTIFLIVDRPVGRPRTRWTDYIKDLGWNRLGLGPSEMMEVMEDREVWRFNLELLPPQPSREVVAVVVPVWGEVVPVPPNYVKILV